MPKYWVSCNFEVCVSMLVEADTVEQAEDKAEQHFDPSDYEAELFFDADRADESLLTSEELAELVK